VVAGLGASARAAIEAEKSQSRMVTQLKASGIAYKEHAKHIDEVIQKTSRLSGLDDEDLQDSFTNLVRATGDVNESLKLTGLAADFARAKHMDVGKVANGNTGILKRYGITIDKGASSSEALAALQKKFAGQAEAYGKTTAGSLDRAQVATENLGETVGGTLTPMVAKLAETLVRVVDGLQPTVKWFKEHRTVTIALATAIASAVTGFVAYRTAVLVAAAATRIWTFDMAALNTMTKTNVFVAVATALVALGTALVVAYKKSETFHRIVDQAFNAVESAARSLAKVAGAAFDRLKDALEAVMPTVRAVARVYTTYLGHMLDAIRGLVRVVVALFHGDWARAWDAFKDVARAALAAVVDLVKGVGSLVLAAMKAVGKLLVRGFSVGITALPGVVRGVGSLLVDGIKGAGALVWDAVTGLGRLIVRGIVKGIKGLPGAVGGALKDGVKGALGAAGKLIPGLGNDVADGFNDVLAARGIGTFAMPGAFGDTGGLAPAAQAGLSAVEMMTGGGAYVSSGRRSVAENNAAHGAKASDHLTGNALDLVPKGGWTPAGTAMLDRVASWARRNPAIRWIGWRGVPNHGPGNHLHLSFWPRGGKAKGDPPGAYTLGALQGLAQRHGFPDPALAAAVAMAESSGRPTAVNRNTDGTIDRGLWQINSIHGAQSTFDVESNANAAFAISGGGRNWSPWTVYKSGAYRRFDHPASIPADGGPAVSPRRTGVGALRDDTASALAAHARQSAQASAGVTSGQGIGAGALTNALGASVGKSIAMGPAHKKGFLPGQGPKPSGKVYGRWQAIVSSMDAHVRAGDTDQAAANAYLRAAGADVLAGKLGPLTADERLQIRGDINQLVDPTVDVPEPMTQEEAVGANATTVQGLLDDVNLRERAGDLSAADASGLRQNLRNRALGGEFGQLSRHDWLSVKGDLVDEANSAQSQTESDLAAAIREQTEQQARNEEATRAQTAAIKANTAVSREQNAMAAAVRSVTGVEVWRALADLVSGQIGQRTNARGLTAGTGSLVLT
jgi:hypothetical protein